MRSYLLLLLAALLFGNGRSSAQQKDSTYAMRLGYAPGARLLILHVDDMGMSYESNVGGIAAITKGVANSCSVMMPCSWVPGFVKLLRDHPGIDAGLHLTLTSEWKAYRWGPLSGKPAVPGLVDSEGALWGSVAEVVEHGSPGEVAVEIKAQLQRAKAMGFNPTHLDSHMGTLFATPAFMQAYLALGIENKLPVMLPAGHATVIRQQMKTLEAQMPAIRAAGKMLWDAGLPVIDDLHNESYEWLPTAGSKEVNFKTAKYIAALRSLQPGITMMIMHCTENSLHFGKISDSGPNRMADLQAMLDPAFKTALEKEGIQLVTWRELMEKRQSLAR